MKKEIEKKADVYAVYSFIVGLITLIGSIIPVLGLLFVHPIFKLLSIFPFRLIGIFIFLGPFIFILTLILSGIFLVKMHRGLKSKYVWYAILGIIMAFLSSVLTIWWISQSVTV